MKKPDDWGRTFREMSVVPRHVEQLAKTDYGPLVRAKIGRRPIKNSGIAATETWLIDGASFPEYSRRNLKVQSESPAQSESRLE